MKPVHLSLRTNDRKHATARSRGKLRQPLTDYSYQAHSLGKPRVGSQKIPSSRRAIDSAPYSELRREARRAFLAEAAIFAVLTIIVVFGLVVCASGLSEFLRVIASSW